MVLLLILACVLCLVACASGDINNTNPQTKTTKNTYRVEIANNYPIENTLKSAYKAGEEVTIKLGTITEHYYIVTVNGTELDFDRDATDMIYNSYTFTMPSKDVLIEIADVWVDIPVAPQG